MVGECDHQSRFSESPGDSLHVLSKCSATLCEIDNLKVKFGRRATGGAHFKSRVSLHHTTAAPLHHLQLFVPGIGCDVTLQMSSALSRYLSYNTKMVQVDSASIKLLSLDPSKTTVSSHGGGGMSSASTAKIVSTLPDGKRKVFFMKTGSGKDAEVMFRGAAFSQLVPRCN